MIKSFIAIALLSAGTNVQAATLVVNSAADTFDATNDCSASCTLREALFRADFNGTITFDPAMLPAVISLESGEFEVSAVTIQGPGASLLAIDAHQGGRIFRVPAYAGSVTISGMTLLDGRVVGAAGTDGAAGTAAAGGRGGDAFGGCILVEDDPPSSGPELELVGVTLRNCTAQGGAGGRGGSGIATATKSGGKGGAGGEGGAGAGGAIYAGFQSYVFLEQTSIIDAHAIGGTGGGGGGGGLGNTFAGVGGSGGPGGLGHGGAIYTLLVKSFRATNATFALANAQGGKGGNGGSGDPDFDLSPGGTGGSGGEAHGGVIADYGGSFNLFQFSTLGENTVSPGLHGSGGRGAVAGSPGQDGGASAAAIQVVIPNPNGQGLHPTQLVESAVFPAASAGLCDGWTQAFDSFVADASCAGTVAGNLGGWFQPLALERDAPGYMPRFGGLAIDATDCVDYVVDDMQETPRPQGAACDLGAIEADYIFVGRFD